MNALSRLVAQELASRSADDVGWRQIVIDPIEDKAKADAAQAELVMLAEQGRSIIKRIIFDKLKKPKKSAEEIVAGLEGVLGRTLSEGERTALLKGVEKYVEV